jgi:hypothetical protein
VQHWPNLSDRAGFEWRDRPHPTIGSLTASKAARTGLCPRLPARGGSWAARPADIGTGVLYVPCSINVNGSGRIAATIAAEGSISLTGTNLTAGPDTAGQPALVSGAAATAVQLTGAANRVLGASTQSVDK